MIGSAGVAPAASLLFTTNWKIILLTFLTGCVVDLMLGWFDRLRVPPFFRQLAAAGLITLVAAGISGAARRGVAFFVGLDSTLLVVGGIVMLVAGMMIVGAFQDAIDQFYVTASARVFEVFMRTAGIVAGIVLALRLAQQLGAPLTISAKPAAFGSLGAQFVAVGLIAALFALSAYADAVTILLAAMIALIGWLGYTTMIRVGLGDIPADTVAALLAATVTTLMIRRTHVPGFGLTTAALLPLVFGLALSLDCCSWSARLPVRRMPRGIRDAATRGGGRRHRRGSEPRHLSRATHCGPGAADDVPKPSSPYGLRQVLCGPQARTEPVGMRRRFARRIIVKALRTAAAPWSLLK
jgi:uncharacterized membrane protein YjjP (DUF1212 family)